MRIEQRRAFQVAHELQAIEGLGVVQHAVVQAGGVAVDVFLHPNRVLRHDDGLAAAELNLHGLVAQGVARGAQNHDGAVAEQVIVAFEFEVVKLTSVGDVSHDERTGAAAALELLREPGLIQFFLLQHMDCIREHFNIADMIQVRVGRNNHFDLADVVTQGFQLRVDHVCAGLARLQEIAVTRRPVLLAIIRATGNRNVVTRVKYDQAFRMIDHPHADGNRDIALLFFRNGGDQTGDGERTEFTAGGPINFGAIGCLS